MGFPLFLLSVQEYHAHVQTKAGIITAGMLLCSAKHKIMQISYSFFSNKP